MAEPTFRWVCTYCDAFGMAESSEMAQLAVEVHLSIQHPHALEPDSPGSQDDGPESSRAGGSD
jgi:hypothetical protein